MKIKCRDCHWCGDRKDEKTGDWKPYCERTGSDIPSYDYEPEYCLGFSFSAEAMQEYAE